MKLAEIAEKSNRELETLLVEQRQALADHVIEMRTKKIPNVKRAASIKRIIARSLTIQRQRELAAADQVGNDRTEKGGTK